MALITDKPQGLPSGNALDDIPDDILSAPAAYLSFGSSPNALDEPPELGDIKTYIVRAKCVGQSCSERQDGELRYGRRLSIIGCWEAGKQPPNSDEDQPGLFDEAGDPNPDALDDEDQDEDEGRDGDTWDEISPAFSHSDEDE